MKLKLRPLSELTGDNYHRRVTMVRKSEDGDQLYSAFRGTMAGIHAMRDWSNEPPPLPDGWCEPIEIEVDDDAANG